jgi:hypothetical protein
VGFLANAKIEGSNFKNEKSHVKKFCSFQLFVNFSTAKKSLTGSKYANIFIQKF